MNKIFVLALCFWFVGMKTVCAQGELAEHSWDLGSEISYIKYEEPGVMEEEGTMYGIVGTYTYHNILNRVMLKIEGKGSWGQVDYENSGTLDDIDDYMLEFRGLGGYDLSILRATILTPYIGFGYRYLNDDMTGTTSSGALGYERESNYFYSPIGIETTAELENGWSLGLKVEYDYFWKGIQKSHLTDANPALNDLENDQNKGYGVRGSVKIQKETEKLDIIIEPFVRYWNVKKSEEEPITYGGLIFGYGYEPKNNSTEIGSRIALKF